MWCLTDGLVGCNGASDRPAVLYTALVHSREPATVMCLVQMLRVLLRDAANERARALHLLASRKLLLLPVANPDGYVWNEMHRRNGGGMKRKNGATCCYQRDSENDGVDLNRNFGYKYAYDSVGSSGNGCSEEYRGTGAFSEPETQAIRAIVQTHRPKAALHWHGWGNDIAFPFSYDWRAPMPAADLSLYQEFAAEVRVCLGSPPLVDGPGLHHLNNCPGAAPPQQQSRQSPCCESLTRACVPAAHRWPLAISMPRVGPGSRWGIRPTARQMTGGGGQSGSCR